MAYDGEGLSQTEVLLEELGVKSDPNDAMIPSIGEAVNRLIQGKGEESAICWLKRLYDEPRTRHMLVYADISPLLLSIIRGYEKYDQRVIQDAIEMMQFVTSRRIPPDSGFWSVGFLSYVFSFIATLVASDLINGGTGAEIQPPSHSDIIEKLLLVVNNLVYDEFVPQHVIQLMLLQSTLENMESICSYYFWVSFALFEFKNHKGYSGILGTIASILTFLSQRTERLSVFIQFAEIYLRVVSDFRFDECFEDALKFFASILIDSHCRRYCVDHKLCESLVSIFRNYTESCLVVGVMQCVCKVLKSECVDLLIEPKFLESVFLCCYSGHHEEEKSSFKVLKTLADVFPQVLVEHDSFKEILERNDVIFQKKGYMLKFLVPMMFKVDGEVGQAIFDKLEENDYWSCLDGLSVESIMEILGIIEQGYVNEHPCIKFLAHSPSFMSSLEVINDTKELENRAKILFDSLLPLLSDE